MPLSYSSTRCRCLPTLATTVKTNTLVSQTFVVIYKKRAISCLLYICIHTLTHTNIFNVVVDMQYKCSLQSMA